MNATRPLRECVRRGRRRRFRAGIRWRRCSSTSRGAGRQRSVTHRRLAAGVPRRRTARARRRRSPFRRRCCGARRYVHDAARPRADVRRGRRRFLAAACRAGGERGAPRVAFPRQHSPPARHVGRRDPRVADAVSDDSGARPAADFRRARKTRRADWCSSAGRPAPARPPRWRR